MRTFIPLLFAMMAAVAGQAQISGPTSVGTGSPQIYSYTASGSAASPQWRMGSNKGTINSQSQAGLTYSATITWNEPGSETLAFLDGSTPKAQTSISITLSPPSANPATNIGTTSFTANWVAVSGASSYRLDVSEVSNFSTFVTGFNNVTVATNSAAVTVPVGKTYYYRVRSIVSAVTSGSSNVINLVTSPVATAPTNITNSGFTANWNTVTGITNYKFDLSTVSDFSSFVSGYNGLSVTGNSVAVTIPQQQTYYYRVRANNPSGGAGNSNTIKVTALDFNYIKATGVMIAGITNDTQLTAATLGQRMITYNYADGLGRPLQVVQVQASPNQKDVVQPVVYDDYGREQYQYLPYVPGENNGFCKLSPVGTSTYAGSPHDLYYSNGTSDEVQDDDKPFSKTVFEPSPLNRPDKNFGPGSDWTTQNKYVQHQYLLNVHSTAASSTQEKVIAWKVDATTGMPVRRAALTDFVQTGGYFSTGQLSIKGAVDEQGNAIREYTNKSGQVVLKKVQVIASSTNLNSTTDWALTYYIYDDLGNLRYVFQPELSKKIHAGSDTYLVTTTDLDNFAFRYKYDARNRMIEKEVPGGSAVYMVYDGRDRLVLTQDGNQRIATPTPTWTFTKYDLLDRPIATGIKDTAVTTQALMQSAVDAHYAKSWTKYGETYDPGKPSTHYYSNYSYPVTTGSDTAVDPNKYIAVTYYDTYDFRVQWAGNYAYVNDQLSQTANGVTYTQPATAFAFVTGQVTGTKVKVLDGGVTGGFTWLKSVSYYDNKGRAVQVISDNYQAGWERTSSVYDFVGKVIKTKTVHSKNNITWTNKAGVRVDGNKLIKTVTGTQWGQSGAASAEILPASTNGWFEFTASEPSNRIIGLSASDPDQNYTSVNFGINLYASSSTMRVFENGSQKYDGTFQGGDILRIERTGTTIRYLQNGSVFYTSATSSSSALMVDAALQTSSATLVDARSSFSVVKDSITRIFEYDYAGRLVSTWHQLNNGTNILLSKNEYNELGQLIDRKLHSTVAAATDAKQSVDYRYNIRGWLTSMNNASLSNDGVTNDDTGDYFGMNLGYNTDIGPGNPSLYNGNISAMRWSNFLGGADVKEKSYTYSYDPMNRITGAAFKEKASSWNAATNAGFSESGYSYDLNGNILGLMRYDKRGSTAAMDNMTYNYGSGTTLSNRLLKVTDAGDDFTGFIDGTNSTNDYTYDANGNMTTDQNKGMATAITYNYLSLPELVTRGGNTVRYIYDAVGKKLTQVANFNGVTKQTDYSGEFTYENDALQSVSHEEGRIVVVTPKLVYTNPGESVADMTASNATLTTVTQNGTEKYVKATSNGTVARTGMFPIGGTFQVSAGERYRIRAKGYRDKGSAASSSAAYLLIQVNGSDIGWPGAVLPQSFTTAQTESWIEQTITVPAGASPMPLQVGLVWNTVLAGEVIYLNEFEITKLESTTPEYQYHLKDHLGNVRLTFTTTQETEIATATMEVANRTAESGKFLRYDKVRIVNTSPLFDHTNGSANGSSIRLSGAADEKVGLVRTLSVMPGDVVSMEVYAKYLDTNTANWTAALTTLIGQISTGNASAVTDGTSYAGNGTTPFPYTGLNGTSGSSSTGPKAYLNYIMFDRDFNPITTDATQTNFVRMTNAAKENGTNVPNGVAHELLSASVTVKQPGYLYIYLSNEETSPVEVYFDDFKVTQAKSPIIQTEDYYPFGLTFNEYQRENSVSNQHQYNGKELQDELNLYWSDYGARVYDPAVGRFLSIDPMANFMRRYSAYAYSFDNPIRFTDPDGMMPSEFGNRDVFRVDKTEEELLRERKNFRTELERRSEQHDFEYQLKHGHNNTRRSRKERKEKRQQNGEGPDPKQIALVMLRMALHVPDAISFSINVDGAKAGVGPNATPIGTVKMLTGPDAGKIQNFGDVSISFGQNLGVAFVFTEYYYIGPSIFRMSDLPGPQLSGSFALSPGLIEAGIDISISSTADGGWIIGKSHEYGVAPEPGPHVSWDVSWGTSWFYSR